MGSALSKFDLVGTAYTIQSTYKMFSHIDHTSFFPVGRQKKCILAIELLYTAPLACVKIDKAI